MEIWHSKSLYCYICDKNNNPVYKIKLDAEDRKMEVEDILKKYKPPYDGNLYFTNENYKNTVKLNPIEKCLE